MSYNSEGKVYVGGLPSDANAGELEDAFSRFGRIRKVWVARRPPGFAFVEFEDVRDAEDSVRDMDGARLCGVRARVEMSNKRGGDRGRRNDNDRGYSNRRRSPSPRRKYSRSPRRSPTPKSRSRSPIPRRNASGSVSPRRDASRSRSKSR